MEYVGLKGLNGEKDVTLKSVSIDGVVTGPFAQITLTQVYKNLCGSSVEVIYIFPGSDTSAISDFQAEIGSKIIKGTIMEKEKAFRDYDDAIRAGDSGFLLEQTRPNVFQVSIGRIEADEEVKVKITYVDQLRYEDNVLRLTIPTVVAPRYIAGKRSGERQGLGVSDPTDKVPDADLITPPLDSVNYRAKMNLIVYGTHASGFSSPSHQLNTRQLDNNSAVLSFQQETSEMDRDIIVCFASDQEIGTSGMVCIGDNKEAIAYLTYIPEFETEDRYQPKNYVFLIDISGSMRGDKLDQTKVALKGCLIHLRHDDTFSIVAFESKLHCFSEEGNVTFSPETLKRAIKWIDELRAMGQTEINNAIRFALNDSANNMIFLLTDGQIGNEKEIFEHITKNLNGSRIFTIGIDSAVNSYFLNRVAEIGKGKSEFVYPGENLTEKVIRHFARITSPSVSNVKINWEGKDEKEFYPQKVESLYDMEPVNIFAFITEPVEGKIILQGEIGGEKIEWVIDSNDLINIHDSEILFKVWAKKKIEYLEQLQEDNGNPRRSLRIRDEIISLSKKYSVISSLTSFVAVYERIDKTSGLTMVTSIVPVSIPKGWTQDERIESPSITGVSISLTDDSTSFAREINWDEDNIWAEKDSDKAENKGSAMDWNDPDYCEEDEDSEDAGKIDATPLIKFDLDKYKEELADLRHKKYNNNLREFPEYYEFSIIKNYEDKYENFTAHGIPLEQINLQIFELKDRIVLVSIEFSKEHFDLENVYIWLSRYNVILGEKGKNVNSILNADKIIMGLRFKGNPIILYEMGRRKVSYTSEDFVEITDSFSFQPQKIDTANSKKVTTGLCIIMNGKQLKEIPRIDLYQNLLICNGQCILADYMDEFCGTLGFFKNNSPLPITYVADKVTTINIDYEDSGWSSRYIVEYDYLIDEDILNELANLNSSQMDEKLYRKKCVQNFRKYLEKAQVDFDEESEQDSVFDLYYEYERYPERAFSLEISFVGAEHIELNLYNFISMEECPKKGLVRNLINKLNIQCQLGAYYVDNKLNVHMKEVIDINDGFNPETIVKIANRIVNAAEKSYDEFRKLLYSFS